MLYSRAFLFTRREIPAETAGISEILLLRAGMVQKHTGGVFSYLPPALRVMQKINRIIRTCLEKAGALEFCLPLQSPADEEVVTTLAGSLLRSYKNLPQLLYRAGMKSRDALPCGSGIAYGREFMATDIYSLDLDAAGARLTCSRLAAVFDNIFNNCGLAFKNSGAGAALTGQDYFALTTAGGEELLYCTACGTPAALQSAQCRQPANLPADSTNNSELAALPGMERISTPGMRTVEEVTRFLNLKPQDLVKTLLFRADEQAIAVLVRGDYTVSPVKLQAALGCRQLAPAGEEVIREVTGAPAGFAGPVGLKQPVPLYADFSVLTVHLAVTGANAADLHFKNFAPGRDLPGNVHFLDLRTACAGEPCAHCREGSYAVRRGIRIAHIKSPSRSYAEKSKAFVLDNKGNRALPWLGSCSINLTALLAALVEQHHDAQGITWPGAVAPFRVIICPVGSAPQVQKAAAELYRECLAAHVDVLLDDRQEQAGVMFKDADLTGIPLRITIGAGRLAEGKMELKLRSEKEVSIIPRESIMEKIIHLAGTEPGQVAM